MKRKIEETDLNVNIDKIYKEFKKMKLNNKTKEIVIKDIKNLYNDIKV